MSAAVFCAACEHEREHHDASGCRIEQCGCQQFMAGNASTDPRLVLNETPAQIADRLLAMMKRLIDRGALRMSIPVRPEDDDMVLVLAAHMLRAASEPAPPSEAAPPPPSTTDKDETVPVEADCGCVFLLSIGSRSLVSVSGNCTLHRAEASVSSVSSPQTTIPTREEVIAALSSTPHDALCHPSEGRHTEHCKHIQALLKRLRASRAAPADETTQTETRASSEPIRARGE